MCLLAVGGTWVSTCALDWKHIMIVEDGNWKHGRCIPASSRLSPLTLESSNALLPPLRSHGQQLGDLVKGVVVSDSCEFKSAVS